MDGAAEAHRSEDTIEAVAAHPAPRLPRTARQRDRRQVGLDADQSVDEAPIESGIAGGAHASDDRRLL